MHTKSIKQEPEANLNEKCLNFVKKRIYIHNFLSLTWIYFHLSEYDEILSKIYIWRSFS